MLDVVAWVHTTGERLLAVRSRGRDRLYLPGGKREPGEDDWSALSREVREELGVELQRETVRGLGVVEAAAHDQPVATRVRMACFTSRYQGRLRPCAEIDEYVYVSVADRDLLAPAAQAALDLAVRRGLLPVA